DVGLVGVPADPPAKRLPGGFRRDRCSERCRSLRRSSARERARWQRVRRQCPTLPPAPGGLLAEAQVRDAGRQFPAAWIPPRRACVTYPARLARTCTGLRTPRLLPSLPFRRSERVPTGGQR